MAFAVESLNYLWIASAPFHYWAFFHLCDGHSVDLGEVEKWKSYLVSLLFADYSFQSDSASTISQKRWLSLFDGR